LDKVYPLTHLSQIFRTFKKFKLPKWDFISRVWRIIPLHFHKCFNIFLTLIFSLVFSLFFLNFGSKPKAKVVTLIKIRIFTKLIKSKLRAWRHEKKWLRYGNIHGKLIDISYHINIWDYSLMMVLNIKIYNFFWHFYHCSILKKNWITTKSFSVNAILPHKQPCHLLVNNLTQV